MDYYNQIKNELINNEITNRVKDYSKNRSNLNAYYNVGKLLSEAGKHYGEGIIKEYSKKLSNKLNINYSVRVLYKMIKFYNCVMNQKVPTLSTKLSRSHYIEIFPLYEINMKNSPRYRPNYVRVIIEKSYH